MSKKKDYRTLVVRVAGALAKQLSPSDNLESALRKVGLADTPESRRVIWDAIDQHPQLKKSGAARQLFPRGEPTQPEVEHQQEPERSRHEVDEALVFALSVLHEAHEMLRRIQDVVRRAEALTVDDKPTTPDVDWNDVIEKRIAALHEEIEQRAAATEGMLLEAAASVSAPNTASAEQIADISVKLGAIEKSLTQYAKRTDIEELRRVVDAAKEEPAGTAGLEEKIAQLLSESAGLRSILSDATRAVRESQERVKELRDVIAAAESTKAQQQAAESAARKAKEHREATEGSVAKAEELWSRIETGLAEPARDIAVNRRIAAMNVVLFLGSLACLSASIYLHFAH